MGNNTIYEDFVDHEQNLVGMIDFIWDDKDVIDFLTGDAHADGANYVYDVIKLANFIKSTQSTSLD